MTSPYMGPGSAAPHELENDYDDERGQGLVTFAGVMLMIAGVINTVYGISAIGKGHVFVHNAHYVFGTLTTWGWLVLALGVLQIFAALAIWRGASWGRWFGVASASVNAILQMLWIPSYPILAMTVLALDVIAIWGLLAYGGRRRFAREARARAEARAAG